MPLATPLNAGCRGKCVYGFSRANYGAKVSHRCDSGQNKTHTFSKREQKYFRPTIRVLLLCSQSAQPFQPLATQAEAWQAISVGNNYGKSRLYTPIHLKTTALPRCACHHSAQRGHPSPPRRGDKFAGKRSYRNHSFIPERVRLLQPLLPRPKKRWRPATYSRSQTPEL